MPTVDVFDMERRKVGEIALDDAVFAAPVKSHLLHEVVRAHLASRRAGTHATKGRSAVRGSTKKIYRQKGTGRARHGARRAPVFRGGGKVHKPRPRDYSIAPPRKVRKAAMRSALSLFHLEGRLVVLDSIPLSEVKTRHVRRLADRFDASPGLIVDVATNDALRLSTRNLPDVAFVPPEALNVYGLLKAGRMLITRAGVEAVSAALRPVPRAAKVPGVIR